MTEEGVKPCSKLETRIIRDLAGVTSGSTGRVSLRSLYRKFGFTLAEVLITLGIIGIVAAMTIPALLAKHEKQETIVRLKKTYSLLNQSLQRAVVDNGEVKEWPDNIDSHTLIKDYFAPTLKVLKIYPKAENWSKAMCYDGRHVITASGIETQYVWFDGVYISSPFITGVTASMKLAGEVCVGVNKFSSQSVEIFVDVNGNAKGPNKAGYDLFFFKIIGNSVKPIGWDWTDEEINDSSKNNACNLKSHLGGYVCAAKIMRDGWQINYR